MKGWIEVWDRDIETTVLVAVSHIIFVHLCEGGTTIRMTDDVQFYVKQDYEEVRRLIAEAS